MLLNSYPDFPKVQSDKIGIKLLFSLLLIVPIILLISNTSIKPNYFILLAGTVLLALFIFNYEFVFKLYVALLFSGINIYYFSISEILGMVLLLSFLVSYKFRSKELKNPLIFPFFIFILSVIPSFINSGAILYSFIRSYNLVAFFLIFAFTNLYYNSYVKFQNFATIFIVAALVNAFYVIFLAITTGDRVFGFTGIMFVDLVSLSLIICLIGFLYKSGRRLSYGVSMIVLLTALIFTQTRGVWIVCGVVIIGILIQSYFKTEKSSISKSKIILIIFFIVISFVAMIFILKEVNPETYRRVAVKSQTENPTNLYQLGSIASRYFIWKVSWNAFLSHPFIGIGLYSFPFTSSDYSNINPILYEQFVKNLTSHTTILALLAEVGLLGFLGFVFFLYKTISLARSNLKRAISQDQWYYSLMIFWMSIYIMFSMIITDAWLWGVLIMVWSIVLSMSIANNRLISRNSIKEEFRRD